MKVYVVRGDYGYEGQTLEGIYAKAEDAAAWIEATERASYEHTLRNHAANKALAERWVKAGGGLTTALAELPSYEVHRAASVYSVEEHEVIE